MILLISYDLNNHESSDAYHAVEAVIKKHSISYAKPLYSQWLVETNDSPSSWGNRMENVTDADDSWLIVQVTKNYVGYLPTNIQNWLSEKI